MSTTLERERGGRVARVTYDNSRRGNCFDQALLTELADVLEEAAADPACAVIRLELAGRNFCGGWDTSSFEALAAAGTDAVAADLRTSDESLGRIRRLPVPVVAAVRGQVIGFGAGLLAAVHLPVAASDVRLSLPEVRYGFAPAGVGHTVAQALPRAQAYALLTGTTATAAQLLAWGLVARVVTETTLDAEVDELVESLAAVPGDALRAVVEVVESSIATGSPAAAYEISARTIVRPPAEGADR
ncbi:enoyl-CoA hydratase/isomerase family protein [Nocardioides marmoriginsengisoli]|nr:enoyl-CoA hydratase/isomerase family protein [Nocardioides marmoriginsengisoli]